MVETDFNQLHLFFRNQMFEILKFAHTMSLNRSTDFWWWRNHGTFEDFVKVVNGSSSSWWFDVSDLSHDLLGSDQSSVDFVDQMSSSDNLSSEFADQVSDLSSLLLQHDNSVVVNVDLLLVDDGSSWPWWDEDDLLWWS